VKSSRPSTESSASTGNRGGRVWGVGEVTPLTGEGGLWKCLCVCLCVRFFVEHDSFVLSLFFCVHSEGAKFRKPSGIKEGEHAWHERGTSRSTLSDAPGHIFSKTLCAVKFSSRVGVPNLAHSCASV